MRAFFCLFDQCGALQALFAGKPRSYRFCVVHIIGELHKTCGSGLAREDASKFNTP